MPSMYIHGLAFEGSIRESSLLQERTLVLKKAFRSSIRERGIHNQDLEILTLVKTCSSVSFSPVSGQASTSRVSVRGLGLEG